MRQSVASQESRRNACGTATPLDSCSSYAEAGCPLGTNAGVISELDGRQLVGTPYNGGVHFWRSLLMKRTVGLVTFGPTCLAVGSRLASAPGRLTLAFSKDALRLMTMTGSDKLAQQLQSIFLTQMLQQFRKDYPNLPERAVAIVSEVVIDAFRKRINGPDGLLQMMVPLYAQHFTHADILRMIEFYESDSGSKVRLGDAVYYAGRHGDWSKVGRFGQSGIGDRARAPVTSRIRRAGWADCPAFQGLNLSDCAGPSQ